MQYVNTGTWAFRRKVVGERIITSNSTKSSWRSVTRAVPQSQYWDQCCSTSSAAAWPVKQRAPSANLGQVCREHRRGRSGWYAIWFCWHSEGRETGWRNEPTRNSGGSTLGSAQSHTWEEALQELPWGPAGSSWSWARNASSWPGKQCPGLH